MGGYLRPQSLAAAMEEVFDSSRLKERRRELAGNLSGGERRMLSIGLTLLLKPKLLLLDEPSSDLAPAMVDLVFEAIGEIHRRLSLPILLVEQNVEKALAIAERVVVLVRGTQALDVPAGRSTAGIFMRCSSTAASGRGAHDQAQTPNRSGRRPNEGEPDGSCARSAAPLRSFAPSA